MTPKAPPDTPYSPDPDVVESRLDATASIAQEIYRRLNGTIGFRYTAWVNFSDAGGGVHHMWWQLDPDRALVTDDIGTAREVAEAHAGEGGNGFGAWRIAVDA